MTDLGPAWATALYTAAIVVLLGVRSWQQHRGVASQVQVRLVEEPYLLATHPNPRPGGPP